MDFSLFHGIPFLNFGRKRMYRGFVLLLGRTCSAAYAISPCGTTKQNHDVAILWFFAFYPSFRNCTNHETYLHSLRSVAFVIDFIDHRSGKAYLISVRRIAIRRLLCDGSLWKFSLQSRRNRLKNIRRTTQTHRLIHEGTPRKRVTDSTAKTSRSTAKRLYFSRVIVRFVFEKKIPRLFFPIKLCLYFYRTGIDFIRNYKVF